MIELELYRIQSNSSYSSMDIIALVENSIFDTCIFILFYISRAQIKKIELAEWIVYFIHTGTPGGWYFYYTKILNPSRVGRRKKKLV